MTNWNALLREQLTAHWDHQVRPRLDGLGDDEYFWEPAPGAWNVRPRGTGTAPVQAGSGAMTIDFAVPEPEPAPVTTIAWRLGHVIVGVLGARNAAHFGGAPVDYESFTYAATAAEALTQLDAEHAAWSAGVEALGEEGLLRPVGAAEGSYADAPYATLVLHIQREVIHHLAEVALLRDLHAQRADGTTAR
ncbi:DinB family protein [Nocardioides sp. 1609]|uniref:DinB family protein n=1 Tax=Nocardioides sp. 1609 TaxID=2508327 RepID=UPI00106F1D24|nr:DinB family protein [Nocardioides sp. 1609]